MRQDSSAETFSVGYAKCEREGFTYFLPKYALHRPAVRAMMGGKVYEPDTHTTVAKIMAARPGNMVHAGTFFGDMLPSFSKACRTVFAFEPVLENYVLAKLCVERNNLGNVLLFNSALGASVSPAKMDTGTENTHRGGASTIQANGSHHVTVVPIDSLGIDDLSIIQLDVEGYEHLALAGARESISRSRPVIMVEDNKNACQSMLGAMGYSRAKTIPGLTIYTITGADTALLG